MIWAMMLVVGASALSVILLERESTMRREASTDAEALAAVHAVEGGLAHVRHGLARNPDYAGEKLVIGACTVEATVVRREPAGWSVTLVAEPGSKRLAVELMPTKGLPKVVERR